jgi:hypothetical protein
MNSVAEARGSIRATLWLADNALNAFAYVAMRVAPPIRAFYWVERVARCCSLITTAEQAVAVINRLGSRGTCLSRALSVAARSPAAHVVIGVKQSNCYTGISAVGRRRSIEAHAWVEMHGLPLPDGTTSAWVEVGRLGRRFSCSAAQGLESPVSRGTVVRRATNRSGQRSSDGLG